jgi:hypothetical protein
MATHFLVSQVILQLSILLKHTSLKVITVCNSIALKRFELCLVKYFVYSVNSKTGNNFGENANKLHLA